MSFNVANNSYDLAPLRRRAAHIQANLLTKRFLIIEMSMHKLLVNEDNAGGRGVIHIGKCSAVKQWDTRRSKVIDRHDHVACLEPLVFRQSRLALDLESDAGQSGCGQVGSSGDCLGTRNVLEAGKQIPDEQDLLSGVLVASLVKGHVGGKKMI